MALKVDATDFRILREIFCADEGFHAERIPLDEIARRLGVHRNTVSSRVKRMTEAGFFLPTSLDVEPSRLGLVATLAFFDLPRERRTAETREALFALEGVQTLFHLHEGWEVIAFARSETELMALLERIRALTGASRVVLDVLSTRDYPAMEPAAITPLDARIVAALVRDARASFDVVARDVGVTAMTVKRHYEKLVEDGVLFVYPTVTTPFDGMVVGWVLVDIPDEADEERVKGALVKELPDHFIRNLATKGRAHFFLFASSVGELDERVAQARKVPGVAGVEMRLQVGLATNPAYAAWLASMVESRAASPAR